MKIKISFTQSVILIGDLIVLLLVTLLGYVTHQAMAVADDRLWATWLPWTAAWLLVAPHLGAFDLQLMKDPRQLWRPFWAMVLASPMGGMLRGFWLDRPVIPLFIVVFGGLAALSIAAWRAAYWVFFTRRQSE